MAVARLGRGAWVIAFVCISRVAAAEPPATSAPPTPVAASTAEAPSSAAPAPAANAAPAPAASAASTPSAAPAAGATTAAAPKAKLTPAQALRAATQLLASASPSEVRQGLLALGELRGDGAARALADRLHAGLPPALTGDAIDVAVQLGSPRLTPVLSELLQHKRATVRRHAISALAALKAKSAQPGLLAALDDPDAEVRHAAIDALVELKVTRAVPALLALVERGQAGALQAIGKLAAARDLSALLAQAKGGDVTPLKPALEAWLADDKRMPAQQLELIAAMTRVASPSARSALVEWLDAAKSAGNPRVRSALFAAIKQLDRVDEGATQKTAHTVVQTAGSAQTVQLARADAPKAAPPSAPQEDSASTAHAAQGAR